MVDVVKEADIDVYQPFGAIPTQRDSAKCGVTRTSSPESVSGLRRPAHKSSRIILATSCTNLSLPLEMPSGRIFPFGLGMYSRLVGLGSYVRSLSACMRVGQHGQGSHHWCYPRLWSSLPHCSGCWHTLPARIRTHEPIEVPYGVTLSRSIFDAFQSLNQFVGQHWRVLLFEISCSSNWCPSSRAGGFRSHCWRLMPLPVIAVVLASCRTITGRR